MDLMLLGDSLVSRRPAVPRYQHENPAGATKIDDQSASLLRGLPQHRGQIARYPRFGNVPCSRYHLPVVLRRRAWERNTVLAEVVVRLAKAYHPERIYLFGSKARGDSGQDSDYDLLDRGRR